MGKKRLTSLLLCGVLATLLPITAMAANDDSGFAAINAPDSMTVTVQTAEGEAVAPKTVDGIVTYPGSEKLCVVTAGSDGRYVVLLLEGNLDAPTKDSAIYYIDQTTAEDGNVTFNVYPKTFFKQTDLTLFITSDVAETQKASLQYISSGPAVMGDLNEDGVPDSDDALKILRYVVKLEDLDELQKAAGDVNGDGVTDSEDSLQILRYVVKLPSVLDS